MTRSDSQRKKRAAIALARAFSRVGVTAQQAAENAAALNRMGALSLNGRGQRLPDGGAEVTLDRDGAAK